MQIIIRCLFSILLRSVKIEIGTIHEHSPPCRGGGGKENQVDQREEKREKMVEYDGGTRNLEVNVDFNIIIIQDFVFICLVFVLLGGIFVIAVLAAFVNSRALKKRCEHAVVRGIGVDVDYEQQKSSRSLLNTVEGDDRSDDTDVLFFVLTLLILFGLTCWCVSMLQPAIVEIAQIITCKELHGCKR